MARSSRFDPLDKFRWLVDIPGFTRMGFTSTQTPGITYNINDYPQGGSHLNPLKIIDGATYKPVALERGVTADPSFSKWASAAMDLLSNNASSQSVNQSVSDITSGNLSSVVTAVTTAAGFIPVPYKTTTPYSYRKDIEIIHVNRAGQAVVTYTLYNAFPIEYTPASDFQAGEEGISIERLVLGYEGFEVKYNPLVTALQSFSI
jgi:phage tail-like protein